MGDETQKEGHDFVVSFFFEWVDSFDDTVQVET